MFWNQPNRLRFLPEHEIILMNHKERDFGTIVHDFNQALDFLGTRPQTLTEGRQLPLSLVVEINARLTQPIQHGLKRSQQKSYPHVQALYLLIRASGLSHVKTSGKKTQLYIDASLHKQWQALTSIEQYFSLVEIWLLRANPEIIGEFLRRDLEIPENFYAVANFVNRYNVEAGFKANQNRNFLALASSDPGWYNIALLELFAWARVTHGEVIAAKGWNIEQIKLTTFGSALLSFLYEKCFGDSILSFLENLPEDENIPVEDFFHSLLKPYFPQWQKRFTLPTPEFQKGNYVFKVSLQSAYRRIAIDAQRTLDEFARAILKSVDFDNDHLYEFRFQNRFGSTMRAVHPYFGEDPSTDDVKIGDLQLYIGQTMVFMFDYGDNWEFDILLESVDENKKDARTKVTQSSGDAPEQYPSWDNWDEEEE